MPEPSDGVSLGLGNTQPRASRAGYEGERALVRVTSLVEPPPTLLRPELVDRVERARVAVVAT
jgi:hypothetical protein